MKTATEDKHTTPAVTLALMGGMSIGGKVRENQVFHLGVNGIEFNGDLSLERWQDLMRLCKACKNAATLWLADAITHGVRRFGQEVVQNALEQMEFELIDADRAMAIGKLTAGIRNPALTTEHYYVLAKAELSEAAQELWAAEALKHGLTAKELLESIAAGKIVRAGAGGRSGGAGGLATIHGVRQLFDTWWRKVDKDDPIHKWDEKRKRELWEELKGPTRVGLQLARSLGLEGDVER